MEPEAHQAAGTKHGQRSAVLLVKSCRLSQGQLILGGNAPPDASSQQLAELEDIWLSGLWIEHRLQHGIGRNAQWAYEEPVHAFAHGQSSRVVDGWLIEEDHPPDGRLEHRPVRLRAGKQPIEQWAVVLAGPESPDIDQLAADAINTGYECAGAVHPADDDYFLIGNRS